MEFQLKKLFTTESQKQKVQEIHIADVLNALELTMEQVIYQ